MDLCQELKDNFMGYAYEVNTNRSFPDSRDGLKFSQRCALWDMYYNGLSSKKPHVKCAKVSGSIISLWLAHSDVSAYETFGRMSQDYINNIPLVSFHGSNGNCSIGPVLAHQRYSECRLSEAAEDGMLKGINKENIPMMLNYSEDHEMPTVLPAILPNLLVNGSMGIGVSIATNVLPHNLIEISNGIINYIKTGKVDTKNFFPDFPSGGIIINKNEVEPIYTTGKGKVILRSKTEIKGNKILITELPYQVYVEPIKEKIIELVDKGKFSGIVDVLNKTSKDGLLVEIEVERGFDPEEVLEKLFELTDLQKTFNANQMALVGRTPVLLTLEQYFNIYLNHNIECLREESMYDLNKAKDRQEIVEGLVKALESIDKIITLIKSSESTQKAKENLISTYSFTDRQAQSIVDMKLGKLAKLEAIELNKELEKLIETIESINNFLNSYEAQKEKVISNLEEFTKKYGTPRKTQLIQLDQTKPKKKEKIIVEENIYVALTNKNELVRRANGNKVAAIQSITQLKTTEYLYLFSSLGNVFRILGNEVPSNPKSVYDLLPLVDGEEVITISPIQEDQSVITVTRDGRIKKSFAQEYLSLKKKKAISIKLNEEDRVVGVAVLDIGQEFKIITNERVMKTSESAHLPKGRSTLGNKISGKDIIVKGVEV